MMKKVLLSCTVLLLLTTHIKDVRAEPVPCPVRGSEAIEAAQRRGYSTNAIKQEGSGNCIPSGHTGVVAAATDGKGLTCRFEFFKSTEGQTFALGWKRREVEFRNAEHQRVPGATAEKPYIAIDVSTGAGQTVTVSMGTLTLEGPDCTKWPDAFSAQ